MFTYVYLDGIKYAHTHTGLYRATHHPGALLCPCCSKLVFFAGYVRPNITSDPSKDTPHSLAFAKMTRSKYPKKN